MKIDFLATGSRCYVENGKAYCKSKDDALAELLLTYSYDDLIEVTSRIHPDYALASLIVNHLGGKVLNKPVLRGSVKNSRVVY